jgi:hypothetical protein
MIRRSVIAGLAMLLSVPAGAETPASEPKAVAIADQVMRSLGGKQAWDDLRGLRWSFGAEVNDTVRSTRRHAWDKHTGWHRVEGTNRQGQPFVLIHNLDTGAGHAWVAGQAVEGDSLARLLDTAKRMWINDTYWMLMPYKMRDPGVTLRYAGEATVDGATFDKVAMSFENVGVTPGDRYWVFVNRKSGRVERWEMILEGSPPDAKPSAYTWEGWQQHGGLWFPTAHRDGSRNVFTRDIEAVRWFTAGTFETP